MTYRYTAYGLNIRSELELPELLPAPEGEAFPASLQISYGDTPPILEKPTAGGVLFQAAPGQFLLKVPNIADYLVCEGEKIIISRAPDSQKDEVRLFLLHSALGAALFQRKYLLLHASAIAAPQGAVVFLGHSGAGKSALAAAFYQQGYPVLADDICAITLDPQGMPFVLPGFPTIYVWADVLKMLAQDPDQHQRARPGLEKFALPVRERFSYQPLPVAVFYFLIQHNQADFQLEPVQGHRKLFILQNFTFLDFLIDAFDLRSDYFRTSTQVSRQAPMYLLNYAPGPAKLAGLVNFLQESWPAKGESAV